MKDLDLTDPISHHKSHAMTPCPVFQNFTPNKEKATFLAKTALFLLKKSSTQVCDVTIRPPFWKAQGWSWAVLSVLNKPGPKKIDVNLGASTPNN
jgi:hypothetical protein